MKHFAVIIWVLRFMLFVALLAVVWYLRGIGEWVLLSLIGTVFLVGQVMMVRVQKRDYYAVKSAKLNLRVMAGEALMLLLFVLLVVLLVKNSVNLLIITWATPLLFLIVHLPFLVSQILILFWKNTKNWAYLEAIKKITPYHPWLRKKWRQSTPSQAFQLMSLEPEVMEMPLLLQEIFKRWVQLDVVHLLSIVKPNRRSLFRFLMPESEVAGRFLNIQKYQTSANQLLMIIATEGDLVPEELFSGKVRAKLIEYFASKNKPIRSFSYNPKTRELLFQFFSAGELEDPEIVNITQKLEIGFTDLNIKNSLNIYPNFEGYEIIDRDEQKIYALKFIYKLPAGINAEAIRSNNLAELASYVRHPLYQHKIRSYDDTLELYVEMNKRDLRKLKYTDFPPVEGLRIPLGFDFKYRRPCYINFDQADMKEGDHGFTPHLLVAGATASGKSNFIKFMVLQLLKAHTPDTLRFFMVDPKVVTFRSFKNLPHLYAPIVSDADKFSVILEGIVQEVERRYRILAEHDAENLSELRREKPEIAKKMPRILVIVDEFADLIDSHDWSVRESINLTIKRLGQKARAAGVHMILITQRATSANIDGEIKANISGRICFKVATEGDSMVVIENPDAANLENPGEGLAKIGDSEDLVHFQAPFMPDEVLKQELKKYEGQPQEFLDQTLADELLKKPLKEEEVTVAMLPAPEFPVVPLGINLESHRPVVLQFARVAKKKELEPTPHVIVAGATASGKSQFAKLLLYQLLRAGGPEEIKIILIDPKAVSFVPFKKAPNLACPLVTKHDQLLPIIREMLLLIEERYELFAEKEVENIQEYQSKLGLKLPYYLLIIDEFADLLDSYSYQDRDEIERILKRFGQMARAAGVHMVLITQRATAQNIPSEVRTNFAGRIAFRMNTESDSYYILEEGGAEKIRGAGHFLAKKAHYPLESGYSPMLSDLQIQQLMEQVTKSGTLDCQYEPRLMAALEKHLAEKKTKEGENYF